MTVTGEVGYLPQNLTLDVGTTVASLLGIASVRDAIRAIEAGSVDPAAFDAVGDDWDIEDRAREWLARLGLSHVGLDDPVRRLSGGETVLTALSARFLRRPGRAAARRADQQPRPGRAAAALRGGRGLAGRGADRQPRPRTALAGGPGRRPVRRFAAHVRRQPGGVRGHARHRAGGGAARGHLGRGGRAAGEARPDRDAGQAGQAGPDGARGRRVGLDSADRRGRAQARGAGVGGQGAGGRPRARRRREGAARRGGGDAPRRLVDPDLAAGDGGAGRADRADGARARRPVGPVARDGSRRAGRIGPRPRRASRRRLAPWGGSRS